MATQSPLKPDDCTVLNGCIQHAMGTAELIEKCKACGFPVEEQEAINNSHMEMARNIKAQFFPNNP
jgi:hypothetical protein